MTKDVVQAIKWYIKSADQENVLACLALAFLYEEGSDGQPKDIEQAIEWYVKAANLGDGYAKYQLNKLKTIK